MQQHIPRLIFCEDEAFSREEFAKILRAENYEVLSTPDPDEALEWIGRYERIDLLLTDVQMKVRADTRLSQIDMHGGRWAGVALARRFRRRFRIAPVIFWTGLYDRAIRSEVRKIGNATLISKRLDGRVLLDQVADMLEGIDSGKRPRIFVVHGHNEDARKELVALLTKEFGLPEPVILRNRASGTLTLIEKIEDESPNVDVVFVLLTPDDKVLSDDGKQILGRARQNVIFELGFFMGMLGRGQGRIILLYTRDVELPSDIEGLLKIDISNGLGAARDEIRRELRDWLRE